MSIDARFRVALPTFALDVAFSVPTRGVIGIFGPSGSGKTTLLRCMAGLTRATEARLVVDGECWQDDERGYFLAPHARAIGYVFQEASLFAHLSVERNLLYGWKRTPATQRRVEFEQAIEWLGLRTLLARRPQHLSGGERQRVAIARALLTSPKLLLLDEPLSAIDEPSKAEILASLEQLQRELSLPVFYVSHSIDEVSRLADHLILMKDGHVLAHGDLRPLLTRLDLPLAHTDSAAAVVEATVIDHDESFHLTRLRVGTNEMTASKVNADAGAHVRVRIQARDISLALVPPQQTSILNVLPAQVVALSEEGAGRTLVQLQVNGTLILARITQKSATSLGLKTGTSVYAQIKSVALLK